jgi:hypothetical protein
VYPGSPKPGKRFLADHLESDVCFKTREPQDSLRHTQTQCGVVEEVEEAVGQMAGSAERWASAPAEPASGVGT